MKLKQALLAGVVAVCLLFSGCGVFSDNPAPLGDGQDNFSDILYNDGETNEQGEAGGFVRAIWVSYLDTANMLSAGYDQSLSAMVENLLQLRVTDVYFQVRAFGDAFYNSEVYPSSLATRYAAYSYSGDPFEAAVAAIKGAGIKIHAWVNPYRLWDESADYNGFIEKLAAADPASVLVWEGRYYLNPASAAAQEKVLAGAAELLQNYDIDGIHMDDYFYPTTNTAFDAASYESYVAAGGALALDDWRRAQTKTLIAAVYALVHQYEGRVFGISPDASIERDYSTHYIDVETLCNEAGYLDYICPQVYFGFENETMPFSYVAQQWRRLSGDTALIIGLACYKVGAADAYAGSGESEWQNTDTMLARQYSEIYGGDYAGVAFYRYDSLFNPEAAAALHAGVEVDHLEITIQAD